jgi:AmmeMemoRadiSam system protein A
LDQPLDIKEQRYLLQLARKAVKAHLSKEKITEKRPGNPLFLEKRGAFVTIKRKGKLRGCIGYPLPVEPLYDAIISMAVAAASEDFRFPSITLDELPETEFEISVLSLPSPVSDISKIEVGTHGIIISKGAHRGLLLPQVPVEWDWDLETYLNHGCLKAGLPENSWRKGARIEVFTAQVFSEGKLSAE